MFDKVDIENQLSRLRNKTRTVEEQVISETKRILTNDLFAEKKILDHLKQYNKSNEVVSEEDVDEHLIYTRQEIKQVAIFYRLKFLESKFYKPEIPYEAVLKIKSLNEKYHKDIKLFKVLAPHESFSNKHFHFDSMLFAKTNYDNYFLIHRWGKQLKWNRKIKYWPLRNFETLGLTLIVCTLIITLMLPTRLITLDSKATYWSGYRAAAFFHLLIFNFGVTAFITFSFAKNFSSSIWNSERDFG